jgi:hypothetical protein
MILVSLSFFQQIPYLCCINCEFLFWQIHKPSGVLYAITRLLHIKGIMSKACKLQQQTTTRSRIKSYEKIKACN